MEKHIPLLATNHYRNNRNHYKEVQSRLSELRSRFVNAPRFEQVHLLQKAHSFAVLSVQTPLHIHEKAFRQLWQNVGVTDSKSDILEEIGECNYCKQKARFIHDSFQRFDDWKRAAVLLENGHINRAHKYILDEFLGVSTVKAPFTLAVLGFTEKMCIDTNVAQVFDIEPPETVVVEKYENLCKRLREKLPTLTELVDPFLFQWIVFDTIRNSVTSHTVWFETVGVA